MNMLDLGREEVSLETNVISMMGGGVYLLDFIAQKNSSNFFPMSQPIVSKLVSYS